MINRIKKLANRIRQYFSKPRKSHAVVLLALAVAILPGQIFKRLPERLYLPDIELVESRHDAPADTLIVMLHAFEHDSSRLYDVRETIQSVKEFRNSDVYMPDLPFGTLSLASPEYLTAELLHNIDKIWKKANDSGSPYNNIVFVGHSMGSLYVRKVYVAAKGETEDAPFEKDIGKKLRSLNAASLGTEREWANKVTKIILMAGMNRGWSVSHHMSLTKAIKMQIGVGVGYALEAWLGRLPIIFSVKRGAPFITQLRLQWLSLEQVAPEKMTSTVQLLGTIDDLVSPDDNIDLVTGNDFKYIDVPYSGHKNIIEMLSVDLRDLSENQDISDILQEDDCSKEPDYNNIPLIRRCKFKAALDDRLLKAEDTSWQDLELQPDEHVTDVLFVIHGIRDEGFWTEKIARRVLKKVKDDKLNRTFKTETSSYGYFPMLSFLQPGARQEKVEWLMDRYTYAKAKYPYARFHYVGHSHGTYLLAKAMQDYEAVRFCQVVFAGSVVRRDYDWDEYLEKDKTSDRPDECDPEIELATVPTSHSRINSITNFVATSDWVVAFFPKAFQSLQVQDLGSAGHDGFETASVLELEDRYLKGGHSAAIGEKMWDAIAELVLNDKLIVIPADQLSEDRNFWVETFGYFPLIVWFLIVAVLTFFAKRIIALNVQEWLKTVFVIAYIWLVFTALTSL